MRDGERDLDCGVESVALFDVTSHSMSNSNMQDRIPGLYPPQVYLRRAVSCSD